MELASITTVELHEQDGPTALMIAAKGGHHECVSILVANGAKLTSVSKVCA